MDTAGLQEDLSVILEGVSHGYGVGASIPLNRVQKWLGHAQLSTTSIYANAVGAEVKNIASRKWG